MPPQQDGIYVRGEEWVCEGKEDGKRGFREPRGQEVAPAGSNRI